MNNLSKTLLFFSFVLSLFMISCASTKQEAPLWTDEYTIDQAFPKDKYIARVGRAESKAASKAFADAELALFFEHTVEAQTAATTVMKNADGKTEIADRELERSVMIKSSVDLFAVEHTDPWFDKKSKRYLACAYIERTEAWKFYEPKLLSAREEFFNIYNQAMAEKDLIKRIKLLESSKAPARNYDDYIFFSSALYDLGYKKYKGDLEITGGIEKEIVSARLKATMQLQVTNDNDNRIYRKVSEILGGQGFIFSDKNPAYKVIVNVEPNKNVYSESITADPGISIYITNGTETLLTYSKTVDRVTGFAAAEAFVNKKIYTALEEELDTSFPEAVKEILK